MFGDWEWKAVNLHFTAYYNLTSFPVKWNPKTKLFKFDFKHPVKYYPWFFSFFILLGVGCSSCLAYVCFLQENVPVFLTWVFGLLICLVFTALGVTLAFLIFGYDTVSCLNCLIQIHDELSSWQLQQLEITRKDEIETAKQSRIGYLVFLIKDRLVYIIVVSCVLAPFIVTVLAESIGINPLVMTIFDVLQRCEIKLPFLSLVVIRILCAIVIVIWVMEAIRAIPTFLIILFLPAQLWVDNTLLMTKYFVNNLNREYCIRKVYMAYMKLSITRTVAAEFVEPEALLVSKGMIRFVPLFLFLCVRMHSIFPIQIYLPILLVTPLIVAGVTYMATLVAKIYTESVGAIESWKMAILPTRKELHLMFGALRPLGFKTGFGGFHFEVLDDDYMKNMLSDVQDRTIELLIVFPESAFK